MDINFEGKRILITGAGKGIGRHIAKCFVRAGAETYAISRTKADLETLSEEVKGVHTIELDITRWDDVRSTISELGKFNYLVNNDGTGGMVPFMEVTEREIDRTFDVNVKALINVSQCVAKGMIELGGGSIVNISSVSSQTPGPGLSVYNASKAAVDMITKCMAAELGPHKIRVNSVNPSIVFNTHMAQYLWDGSDAPAQLLKRMPYGKFADLENVKDAVMFFLSDKSGVASGQNLRLDSGYY